MNRTTPEFSAVLFDMDGVIFDTEKVVIETWQQVARVHDIPDIEKTLRNCLGVNPTATRQIFLERYGADFPYDQYKAEMRDLFFGPYYEKCLTLKKGVREILTALQERRIPVALATSSPEASVQKELADAGIRQYFDCVICGDMVTRSKPDPEIFLKACQSLGVEPTEAVVIEDSYNGIRAAYAGGMMPVMVPDLLPPTEEIQQMTVKVCESLLEVKTWLGL